MLISKLRMHRKLSLESLRKIAVRTRLKALEVEKTYMEMKNIGTLINQLVFFILCGRLFMPTSGVTLSFYTLIFLNVIAYCVSYVKEIVEREDWSMYVHVASTSNVKHLAMSATKIVLEWTKAITFIMTTVFLLLIFSLEKGLKNYTPTTPYLIFACLYYFCTEGVFVTLLLSGLEQLKLQRFESLEVFYGPLVVKSAQFTLSVLMTLLCAFYGQVRLVILSCLTNLRLKYRELHDWHWIPLQRELRVLERYRVATSQELDALKDVCAICLGPMVHARVTPCSHFFHADCLRKCLKGSEKCPICQVKLTKCL